MEVDLKIKENYYKESPDGKNKTLIKKNVVSGITIETSDILAISDLLSYRGNILKNYCRIHLKEIGPVVVNHSREQINKLKKSKTNAIGFKQKHR